MEKQKQKIFRVHLGPEYQQAVESMASEHRVKYAELLRMGIDALRIYMGEQPVHPLPKAHVEH